MFHLRGVPTERSVTRHWREFREVKVTSTTTSLGCSTITGSRSHRVLQGQILLLNLRGEIGRGRGGVVVLGVRGRDVVAEGRRSRDVGAGSGPSNVRVLERLLRSGVAHKTWRSCET